MAVNHKFTIAGHEGYLNVGLFEDNKPGEVFITMAKEGSTIGGLMDSVATLTSMALQYGVPLDDLVRKFSHQRFEPSGFTNNPEIRSAASVTDYIFRWLAFQFIPGYREANSPNSGQQELPIPGLQEELKKRINRPVPELPVNEDDTSLTPRAPGNGNGNGHGHQVRSLNDSLAHLQHDAPTCPNCGHITVRNGACYKCMNCGESLGCS
jgi:ribonucleoside-diphosphate reductase alpha chain